MGFTIAEAAIAKVTTVVQHYIHAADVSSQHCWQLKFMASSRQVFAVAYCT
jgi:hypothetical protein